MLKSNRASRIIFAAMLCTMMVSVVGCAETKKGTGVRASGFLGDYSVLRKGGKGEAEFVYQNPNVNWTRYRSIQLDPVTYWRDSKGRYSQGIPVLKTYRIPVRHLRFSTGLRPGYRKRLRFGVGRSGSMISHRSSSKIGRAMNPPSLSSLRGEVWHTCDCLGRSFC